MRTYRLIEMRSGRSPLIEEFDAPDDEEALERVGDVVGGAEFELWSGVALVAYRRSPPAAETDVQAAA